jgi:beta-glucosidase-like glycosyl hydrolase
MNRSPVPLNVLPYIRPRTLKYEKDESINMGASIDGVICQPRSVYIPPAGGAKGREESLPSLTIDEATGLIALEGIVFANANLGKCLKDLKNCNLMWTPNTIAKFQRQGFVSFHIYGGHSQEQLRKIQAALANPSRRPRIVSIDQETGFVNRFGWIPNFKYISPSMLAASGNPKNAEEAGYLTGQLLALYGINLNFAPFVDLHAYTPARRFSDDPDKIAVYAKAFMGGLLRAGVGACAKHFPDGSANQNPHDQVSRVTLPFHDLHVTQRYQPLIDAGLPAIMVGHDIFTQVDPKNPASLSRRWITDILRGQMNFKGVVVTDALGMGAIQKQGITVREAILRAFEAGADLLLVDPNEVRSVLKNAVASGRISPERVCESARRLQILARRFPISTPPTNRNAIEANLVQRAAQLYQRIKDYRPEK